jgi:hypothetical protein
MNSQQSDSKGAGTNPQVQNNVAEVAEQVGREILESRLEPGAWATALYECGGRREDALAMYARLRIRALTSQRRVRLVKVHRLESRRLTKCMGDQGTRESIARSIQEMIYNTRQGDSLNFVKPKLSAIWLTLLFIGSAGTVASMGRLVAAHLPGSFAHSVMLIALLAGVGTVWSALILRYFLPKRWIMLGWNSGLVVACNIVCLTSLFLGTKVIKHAIATDSVVLPIRQQAAAPMKPTAAQPVRKVDSYLVSTGAAQPDPKE